MGFLDMRQWMASLEQQGELRRIKAEVDWDRESALSRDACSRRKARRCCSRTSKATKTAAAPSFSQAASARAHGWRWHSAFRVTPRTASWCSTSMVKNRETIPPIIVDTRSGQGGSQGTPDRSDPNFRAEVALSEGGRYIHHFHLDRHQGPDTG